MTKRLLAIVLVLAAWVGGTVAGSLGTTPAAASDPGILIGKAHADYAPTLTGSKPIVILAVGSGARPGDDVSHSLSDSLHLIFINPDQHAVAMSKTRLHPSDVLLVQGGPDLMVQTIETHFGVHIDYWAITTFWGFKSMIDDIGGLTVNVPFRMLDSYSGVDLQPGVQELSGEQALAMSRDRHSMLSGDFTRQENGGRLFLAALAQFQKEYGQDPTALLTWLGAGLSNMSTTLTADQVVQLAYTVTAQPVKKVQNIVLPGSSEMISGVSAVALNDAAASAIMSDASQEMTFCSTRAGA